nr:hypothetical protein GCM10020093_071320 [Planobispora longispora]
MSLLDARSFWASVMVSVLDSLAREEYDEEGIAVSQLQIFLGRLAALVDVNRMVRRAVTGRSALSRMALDTFVEALRRFDRALGRECQDTVRALVLLASADLAAQDVGAAFLSSTPRRSRASVPGGGSGGARSPSRRSSGTCHACWPSPGRPSSRSTRSTCSSRSRRPPPAGTRRTGTTPS